MEVYTVAFIGHRYLDDIFHVESKLEDHIWELLRSHEYVEFLVGRNGEFDQAVASSVRRMKQAVCDCNSSLVWVLPYPAAEYEDNMDSFHDYYDEVELCEESNRAQFDTCKAKNFYYIPAKRVTILNCRFITSPCSKRREYLPMMPESIIAAWFCEPRW